MVVSPSSRWISGTAMETMVWSMKVIDTAKIIAARIRFLGAPPPALLSATISLTGASSDPLVNPGGHSNAARRPPA